MSGAAPLITGIGVVAPTGIGVADHWSATLAGAPRLTPIDAEGSPAQRGRLAGTVPSFDEREWVDSRVLVQTDRWSWMGLAATQLALTDAVLDPADCDPYDVSVVTASASGGNLFGQREIHALWRDSPRAVSAYQSIGWFYAASSGQISIRHQLKGACGVLVADGAGGIDSLAAAARSIRRGVGAVVVGGTEAPLSPYALVCQLSEGTLSSRTDPATAYRPFSPDACGYVPGEGGAMLVVEDPEFAAQRSAPDAYARLLGTAATHDARHPTDGPGDHRQLARAVREAMRRAGCGPADIDVVFADGWGDPEADRAELLALREGLEGLRVPVTVPKTLTGRLCSGGAALDVAWAALAIRHGVIPPTVNVDPDTRTLGIDLVDTPREVSLRRILVVARGTGGFNAAAVVGSI
ncbi:beta-ketoacyl synthase N-terminal-like domain-containing protein [Cryptosporangium minutisporangium]|uniref:Ketosynthase chain-length factor n=1 Tax=Cryptosporangium minutisporangium TaxID=113569 RepID=A0ABP6SQQ2_9ACTN